MGRKDSGRGNKGLRCALNSSHDRRGIALLLEFSSMVRAFAFGANCSGSNPEIQSDCKSLLTTPPPQANSKSCPVGGVLVKIGVGTFNAEELRIREPLTNNTRMTDDQNIQSPTKRTPINHILDAIRPTFFKELLWT